MPEVSVPYKMVASCLQDSVMVSMSAVNGWEDRLLIPSNISAIRPLAQRKGDIFAASSEIDAFPSIVSLSN